MTAEYDITPEQAEFIHDEAGTAALFEEAVSLGAQARTIAAWLSSDIRKVLNREGIALTESPLNAARLAELIGLIDDGLISGKIAKNVLDEVFARNEDPKKIVEDEGWSQITDPKVLTKTIRAVFASNSDVVEAVRNGEAKQRGWLMGTNHESDRRKGLTGYCGPYSRRRT